MPENRNAKNKKIMKHINGLGVVAIVIIILAVIFLISGGGYIHRSNPSNQAEIENNVRILKALEEKAPTNFKLNRPGKIVDMQAEQEKILALRDGGYDLDEIRRWYKGTAIIGDSITLRTSAYGFLDNDVVCGKVSGALYDCEDVVQAGIDLHPYVIFLCFGANDMTGYVDNAKAFTEAYDELVERLKDALPEAVIYIDSILPPQPGNNYVDSSFQYRQQLNDALEEYCEEEEDVYYIDSSFILDNNTDIYDFDGIHPTGEFFPMWLTYMADVAGLSADSEESEETTTEAVDE